MKFIDKFIDKLTDKIAEKIADYIIKKQLDKNLPDLNPSTPIPSSPNPIPKPYPSDPLGGGVVMYGCTISSYTRLNENFNISDVGNDNITIR